MDKIKREALDLAMRSIAGRPAEEIVKAAEVFEAYLTGNHDKQPVEDGTMVEVSPEEMNRSNHLIQQLISSET